MPLQRSQGLRPIGRKRLAELEAAGQPAPFSTLATTSAGRAADKAATARKRPRDTGPSREVVDLVLERDQHSCVLCGVNLHGQRGRDWSIQHRDPRGMGGTRRPEVNRPSSLVALCGSGTTGCHGWAEVRRREAEALGLLLRGNEQATQVPVATWYGVVLLDDEGGFTHYDGEAAA